MRKLLASLLFVTGCSAAYADQPGVPVQVAVAGPRIAIASAPEKVRAPYDVQVIRENGEVAPTYAQKDRFYVQGNQNERYIIRVTNPTANRVEAVVSVDGLDVVDGDAGDLHKRGYVIQPYGEVRIEGFRTSTQDVATFRFSSVVDSYAGKQGKARNVGVIAAAIFEEEAQPVQQIVESPPPPPRGRYNYEDDLSDASPRSGAGRDERSVRREEKAPADAPSVTATRRPAPAPAHGAAKKSFRAPAEADGDVGGGYAGESAPPPVEPQRSRPGLGTEFGEARQSAAQYTRFTRSGTRPIAVAELRYNDVAGLVALGIPVQPIPDEGELMTRETADPFPGDQRFSRAPR